MKVAYLETEKLVELKKLYPDFRKYLRNWKESKILCFWLKNQGFNIDQRILPIYLESQEVVRFEQSDEPFSKKRILVVEDDDVYRHILNSYFTQQGHEVYAFDNVKEARQKLKLMEAFQVQLDIAFIDYKLPDQSGVVLADYIKITYPNVKLKIVTSANLTEEEAHGHLVEDKGDFVQNLENEVEITFNKLELLKEARAINRKLLFEAQLKDQARKKKDLKAQAEKEAKELEEAVQRYRNKKEEEARAALEDGSGVIYKKVE